jgi:hypothetical protein
MHAGAAVPSSDLLDGMASLASKYPYEKNSNYDNENVSSEDAEPVEKCRWLSKWIVLVCRLRTCRIDERVNGNQNSDTAEQDQRWSRKCAQQSGDEFEDAHRFV